jgi:hypothetical protein
MSCWPVSVRAPQRRNNVPEQHKSPEGGLRGSCVFFRPQILAGQRLQNGVGIMSVFPWGDRPSFSSVAEWLKHHDSCVASGTRPWHPVTRAELELAEELGLLSLHPEWIPGNQGLRLLGLPEFFGRRLPAFSPRWQERAIQTLIDYPETLAALRSLIMREQSA